MPQIRLAMSAMILAGGASTRMGRDKAWIELAGKPLIQLAAEKLRALGASEIFISGRMDTDYSGLHLPVLFDLEPGFGPLAGIDRGLLRCTAPLLLVLAVDLPQMPITWLRKLAARCDRLTGAVPMLKGQFEPLVAIYPRRCHALACAAITQGRHAVQDFVQACVDERAVRVVSVSPAHAGYFVNCNRPDDLMRATQPHHV